MIIKIVKIYLGLSLVLLWAVWGQFVFGQFLGPASLVADSKVSVYNVGDLGSIPRSGRSSGEGNGNPLQYCCLENSMHRGAWQATVNGVAKSRTQLSDYFGPAYISQDLQATSYVVGTNDRVLVYCTCHFQGGSLCFSFCLLVSSVSDFRPDTKGVVVDTFFRLTCLVALCGGRGATNK